MTAADTGDRTRLMRGLFPELAAELDGALAANGGAADDFDAWLDGETARLRATTIGAAAYTEVLDVAQRERFERAFAAASAVAAWLDLALPQPEAFAHAGVAFSGLGAVLAADPTLLPVPAPHGLGMAGWRRLFERAAADDGPLSHRDGGSPLVLASEAEREFTSLDRAAAGVPVVRDSGGVDWTLRLVPAGLAPAVLGLSFEHGPHATLPEMLMLQLMRAVAGEPLVDARSFTWLAGTLSDGRLAARHVYDAAEHSVRINCREVGNQGPHLGARPPIG